MKVVTPKFTLTITEKAINNLAENPFKFPKPDKVKARLEVGEGKIKPNVAFSTMMDYLYMECMRALLKRFKQNMVDTFDKVHKEGETMSAFICGHTTLKRSVYLYPWEVQCSLVSLNNNLTAMDIDIILAEIQGNRISTLEKDFGLEILNAELKYRVKNEPLQVKGNALNTPATKE